MNFDALLLHQQRSKIIEALREQHATDPHHAVTAEKFIPHENWAFHNLLAQGVVVKVGDAFYLDEKELLNHRKRSARLAVLLFVLTGFVAAVLAGICRLQS